MYDSFLPYDLCLEIKHLGYDGPYFRMYHGPNTLNALVDDSFFVDPSLPINTDVKGVPAILYDDAIEWFEKKFEIFINVIKWKDKHPYQWFANSNTDGLNYLTRREALRKGISETIDSIIKLRESELTDQKHLIAAEGY